MESSKQALRQAMQSQRAALDDAAVRFAGRHLVDCLAGFAPYIDAPALLVYRAIAHEVPTDELIYDALVRGKAVYLPEPGGSWFAEYRPGAGASGAQGQSSVGKSLHDGEHGIVVVPLLACSATGDRLGRGGGWYDRVLPRLQMLRIGVGYEFQMQQGVPNDSWDAPLNYVVTENRLVECDQLSRRRDLVRERKAEAWILS